MSGFHGGAFEKFPQASWRIIADIPDGPGTYRRCLSNFVLAQGLGFMVQDLGV